MELYLDAYAILRRMFAPANTMESFLSGLKRLRNGGI